MLPSRSDKIEILNPSNGRTCNVAIAGVLSVYRIQYIIVRTNHTCYCLTDLATIDITPPDLASICQYTRECNSQGHDPGKKKQTNGCCDKPTRRLSLIEACSSCSGEEGKLPGHCMVAEDMAVAAAAADVHCSMAHAIQDTLVDHSHDWEVADVAAAGTDQGVVRHMADVVVARHTRGMAVSMQILALVESIQTLNLLHVEQHRQAEHEEHVVVVMDCSDLVEQNCSSAWLCGWKKS